MLSQKLLEREKLLQETQKKAEVLLAKVNTLTQERDQLLSKIRLTQQPYKYFIEELEKKDQEIKQVRKEAQALLQEAKQARHFREQFFLQQTETEKLKKLLISSGKFKA
eukprot:TRINITY_DN2526_c0_g1_i1.p2 TRINITY_DN2526_c0_g1~~TRINITY_DN2526_c0_g1_i1.p2  ORF type:complete len:109 (-),score=35.48 TRINITY_DN2526_c0_g1_i1:65-391(-)